MTDEMRCVLLYSNPAKLGAINETGLAYVDSCLGASGWVHGLDCIILSLLLFLCESFYGKVLNGNMPN